MLFAAATVLPACSAVIADLPNPVGLPADTPARSTTPPAYPAVHDMPPERADATLSTDEQLRMERELATARDRAKGTQKSGKRKKGKKKPAKKKPATTARAQPAGSNRNP